VCGGGLAALVGWGIRGFVKDLPAATAVSDQFFDALQQGRIDDAYALTSAKFRAEQNREEFAQFLKKFETLTRHTSRTQNGFRIFHDGSGKRAFIQTTLHAPNNALTCTLVLIEEAGTWKVEQLTVP
jgi:hypothetical protein